MAAQKRILHYFCNGTVEADATPQRPPSTLPLIQRTTQLFLLLVSLLSLRASAPADVINASTAAAAIVCPRPEEVKN